MRQIEQPAGRAVETQDVTQHSPETRPCQITPLPEQGCQAGAGVFQAALVERYREGHVGGVGLDTQGIEQLGEQRVVGPVEYHEPGIDRHHAIALVHDKGMRVSAEARLGLEQGHIGATIEQPGRTQATDATANHCDAGSLAHGICPDFVCIICGNVVQILRQNVCIVKRKS